MSGGGKVFKNARILLAAEVVNVAAGILAVILLARLLDAASLGLYSFSFSVGSVLGVLCFFGASSLVVREIARDSGRLGHYLGASLFLRLSIFAALGAGTVVVLAFSGFTGTRLAVAAGLIFSRVMECFMLMGCAFFRAHQEMEHEGAVRLGVNLSNVLIGLPLLFITKSLPLYAAFQALLCTAGALTAYALVFKRYKPAVGPSFNARAAASFAREGYKFSAFSALLVIYVQTNTILLTFFHGDAATGLYTAGFRFVSALGMIAMSLNGALLPAISKLSLQEHSEQLISTYLRAVKSLLTVAAFFGLGLFVFAPTFIHIVYGGNFSSAVTGLRIMALSPILAYWNSASANILFSIDQEAACLRILASCVAFVVVINIILLPPFGHIGASVTTLLPEVFCFILQQAVLKKFFPALSIRSLAFKFAGFTAALAALGLALERTPLAVQATAFALAFLGGMRLFNIWQGGELEALVGRVLKRKEKQEALALV